MDTANLLKAIGGQAAIARECEISESAVSQWAEKDELPNARQKYLKLAHPGEHWAEYEAHQAGKKSSAGQSVPVNLPKPTAGLKLMSPQRVNKPATQE